MRFEALDSWRGLAAVMVVLFHAQIISHVQAAGLVRAGEAFVDFFFVLSGFVVAHAYLERLSTPRDLGRFLFLRLGRLYPLHFAMLVLFLLFEAAKAFLPSLVNAADPAFSGTNEMSYLASNLVLAQALWPFDILSWNTPSWSISAEFLTYALFGLAVLFGRKRLTLWLVLAAIAAPLLMAGVFHHGMVDATGTGFLRAIYGFSIGALVYLIFREHIFRARDVVLADGRSGRLATAIEIAAATAAIGLACAAHETAFSFGLPFVFALVVGVFAVERGHVSRFLKLRPLMLLGTLSYSIYMVHMFVQLRLLNAARLADSFFHTSFVRETVEVAGPYGEGIDPGNLFLGDLLVVAMLLAVIVVSCGTWRLVERPGQNLFRRWAGRLFAAGKPQPAREQRGLEAAAA